jgi:putative ATP-binding cassette transporter
LDEEGPWDQTLSGGEKQRLTFSRILLHSPDIVVLDEATAALDPASQIKLMEMVADRPETTLLSVGHRPELEAFHTRKIELERRREGAKLVRDVDLPAEPALRSLWRWMRRSRMRKGARANAP